MAYLLLWYRTAPGLTGDPCTHIGVWEKLEDAQEYSERHGGQGAWRHVSHDSVDYWMQDTADQHVEHMIEEIAYIAGTEAVDGSRRRRADQALRRG